MRRPHESRAHRLLRGWWFVVVPVLSFGLAAGLVVAWAGVRARRRDWVIEGIALAAAAFAGALLSGQGHAAHVVGGALIAISFPLGIVWALLVRRRYLDRVPPGEEWQTEPWVRAYVLPLFAAGFVAGGVGLLAAAAHDFGEARRLAGAQPCNGRPHRGCVSELEAIVVDRRWFPRRGRDAYRFRVHTDYGEWIVTVPFESSYRSSHEHDQILLKLWGRSPVALVYPDASVQAVSDPSWLWRDRLIDGSSIVLLFGPVALLLLRRRLRDAPHARWFGVPAAAALALFASNEVFEARHATTLLVAAIATAAATAVVGVGGSVLGVGRATARA